MSVSHAGSLPAPAESRNTRDLGASVCLLRILIFVPPPWYAFPRIKTMCCRRNLPPLCFPTVMEQRTHLTYPWTWSRSSLKEWRWKNGYINEVCAWEWALFEHNMSNCKNYEAGSEYYSRISKYPWEGPIGMTKHETDTQDDAQLLRWYRMLKYRYMHIYICSNVLRKVRLTFASRREILEKRTFNKYKVKIFFFLLVCWTLEKDFCT